MKKAKAIYFETALDRMAPWPFRRIPYAFWFLIFLVATFVTAAFALEMQNPRAYIGFCLSQAAGFLTVPLVFRFAYSRLSDCVWQSERRRRL